MKLKIKNYKKLRSAWIFLEEAFRRHADAEDFLFYVFTSMLVTLSWRRSISVLKLWSSIQYKRIPCVDIGKVLGVRTTTTEAIRWWLSANDEVILEERTRHFGVLSVLSTIQIISPCTDTIQQFDIELKYI